MMTLSFEVPLYRCNVKLLQIESDKDIVQLEKICKKNHLPTKGELYESIRENVLSYSVDGGETLSCFERHQFLVVLYPFTNKEERNVVYAHEKRHIEDKILKWAGVQDNEAAAYLAGWLGGKFDKLKELCEKQC